MGGLFERSVSADSDSIVLLILATPLKQHQLNKKKIGNPVDPDSWHALTLNDIY